MDLLEKSLIEHCAPTLASLKMANLFTYSYQSEEALLGDILCWNGKMNQKGIFLTVLRRENRRALIYVYRPTYLKQILDNAKVKDFLSKYEYQYENFLDAIEMLKNRLRGQDGFPHEIGIFLGYPLIDVVGFIENAGKNFLYAGFWKVYGDQEETQKKFDQYKKCTEVYTHLWHKGRSAKQLTVAA